MINLLAMLLANENGLSPSHSGGISGQKRSAIFRPTISPGRMGNSLEILDAWPYGRDPRPPERPL